MVVYVKHKKVSDNLRVWSIQMGKMKRYFVGKRDVHTFNPCTQILLNKNIHGALQASFNDSVTYRDRHSIATVDKYKSIG